MQETIEQIIEIEDDQDIIEKLAKIMEYFDEKDNLLRILLMKYDSKRHELYNKRDANQDVDENLISALELINDCLINIRIDLIEKYNRIEDLVYNLERHLDSLNLNRAIIFIENNI